jgi:hypothetical protein
MFLGQSGISLGSLYGAKPFLHSVVPYNSVRTFSLHLRILSSVQYWFSSIISRSPMVAVTLRSCDVPLLVPHPDAPHEHLEIGNVLYSVSCAHNQPLRYVWYADTRLGIVPGELRQLNPVRIATNRLSRPAKAAAPPPPAAATTLLREYKPQISAQPPSTFRLPPRRPTSQMKKIKRP